MTDPQVTVIVGGGDDATRSQLASAISDCGARVVGSVGLDQVVSAATDGVPDVVVVLEGEVNETSAAVDTVVAALPAVRVVLVFDAACRVPASRVVDAGVAGVVDGADAHGVASAVVGVAHGEGFPDGAVAAEVIERHRRGEVGRPLSDTEDAVLARLAEGDAVETIATDYVVSERLVRLHAGGAMARLGPGGPVGGQPSTGV
ncbi:MAG: LuxR C-terminal-related transcriptional regulator [Acidimicrobiales bacterium]